MQKNGLISVMFNPLLNIDQLSVDFVHYHQSTAAIKNVSLTVQKGEWVAIVGESGSGKSVTALSVLQLISGSQVHYKNGHIHLKVNNETIDLLKVSNKQLRSIRGNKIGMVFQEPMSSLNPLMTCGAQIVEALQTHVTISSKKAQQKAIQLLQQVELKDPESIFRKFPHQLSGGQKQRVMLAMAMSCQPDLLICDEPTTALDGTVQKKLLDLLQQLQKKQNIGILFISHDLGVVKQYAHKIMVMYKGHFVECNTTQQIFNNPQHPYTKALLACRPSNYTHNEILPLVQDFIEELPDGKIVEKKQINKSTITSPYHPTIENNEKQPILQLNNVCVSYVLKKNWRGKPFATKEVVKQISMEVLQGEIFGIAGESGCGKSTLAKAIMQIVPLTNGSIYFKNAPITKHSKQAIQMVFQDPYAALNPRQTIGAAIAEPMKVYQLYHSVEERKKQVLQLMEKVKLPAQYFHKYPRELSGGQRQRVVIARALAVKPEFIIFDESVAALDVSVQAQILNLINELKHSFQFSAIFISHDLGVLQYLCDKIMIMYQGKIEAMGTPEQIFQNANSTYTQELINAIL
jgi:peptide/nickel transport system ATP-binding protein